MLKFVILAALVAVGIYYLSDYCQGCKYETNIRIDGKIAIVTGGNTGIGKETVKDLVQRGAKVYVACRSEDKGRAAIADLKQQTGSSDEQMVFLKLDLASLDSVRQFVADFKKREQRLDILINNAGVMFAPRDTTVDGYEITFATNHLGHFLLTHLLADMLVASAPSRVVTVSSVASEYANINFDDLMMDEYADAPYQHSYLTYCQSKLANVLFAKELAERLEGTGVTSYSLHPGGIKTELGRYSSFVELSHVFFSPFFKTPYYGARTTIFCALEPGLESENGNYFSDCAVKKVIDDKKTAIKLWDVSIDLVKLQRQEIHPKLMS